MYYTKTKHANPFSMQCFLFGFASGIMYFLFFSRMYWVGVGEATVMAALCAIGAWTGTALMKMLKNWYLERKKNRKKWPPIP